MPRRPSRDPVHAAAPATNGAKSTRLSGCTVKAVRFYEAIGLLPRPARSPSGYRLYTEQDLVRLAFIQRAKLMGLPLGRIKDLVVHLSEKECARAEDEGARAIGTYERARH